MRKNKNRILYPLVVLMLVNILLAVSYGDSLLNEKSKPGQAGIITTVDGLETSLDLSEIFSTNSATVYGSLYFNKPESVKIVAGDRIKIPFSSNELLELTGRFESREVFFGESEFSIGLASLDREAATIVFNENAASFYELNGYFNFKIDLENISDEDQAFSIADRVITIPAKPNPGQVGGGETGVHGVSDESKYNKHGYLDYDDPTIANWSLRFNHEALGVVAMPTNLSSHLRIEDRIQKHGQDHILIEDSVYVYVEKRNEAYGDNDLVGQYKEGQDSKSFARLEEELGLRVFIDSVNGRIILETDRAENLNYYKLDLGYKTQILNPDAKEVRNNSKASFIDKGEEKPITSNWVIDNLWLNAMANGTLPGELLISKVVEGTSSPIEGVEFELSRLDGREILGEKSKLLITNQSGVAKIGGLRPGDYILREKAGPSWIEIDSEPHRFTIGEKDYVGKNYKIENKLTSEETMEIRVKKSWVGEVEKEILEEGVKVKLIGNGKLVDMTILNEDNGWEASFQDLEIFYGSSNQAIKYEIREEGPEGYRAEIIGSPSEGFLIINHMEEPEEPGTDKPEEPGTDEPEEPGTDKPEEPGTDKPEEPGIDKPEKPGTDKPEEPGTDEPEEPGTDKPEEPSRPHRPSRPKDPDKPNNPDKPRDDRIEEEEDSEEPGLEYEEDIVVEHLSGEVVNYYGSREVKEEEILETIEDYSTEDYLYPRANKGEENPKKLLPQTGVASGGSYSVLGVLILILALVINRKK